MIMSSTNLIFQKHMIEQKTQKTFQDTYAAIASSDAHKALFYLGSFVTYVSLLGNDYREDSRYYILSNLILDKFGIQMDNDSVKH